MPLGLLALASILSITAWTPPAPLPTLNIRCSAPVLPRRPSARGRAHSGVRDGLSTPLDHSPSPCMLAAARGGTAGSSITLLGGGAAAAATLAALMTSGPPARTMLGVAGVALASCSTGFLATHATVRPGRDIAILAPDASSAPAPGCRGAQRLRRAPVTQQPVAPLWHAHVAVFIVHIEHRHGPLLSPGLRFRSPPGVRPPHPLRTAPLPRRLPPCCPPGRCRMATAYPWPRMRGGCCRLPTQASPRPCCSVLPSHMESRWAEGSGRGR